MIREAQLSDVVDFLSERGMNAPDRIKSNCVIINELMMLAWFELTEQDCEVHICVKKRGLRHLGELISVGIAYLHHLGFSKMTTAIKSEYKASTKLVHRLGFDFVGCYNEYNIYTRAI